MSPLHCLLQDDHLVVLDKPAGLLSVPGKGEAGQHNLWSLARQRWPDVQVVHRLDMATSGLLLMARGAQAQRTLSQAFAQREVSKHYVALVQGLVAGEAGTIDLPLITDWPNRPRQKVDPVTGKPSLTRWRVLQRDPAGGRTRLALEPLTGRSHQLRVHLAALGHPIVGDALYGTDTTPQPRMCLHAQALGFAHPCTGEPVHIQSAAPF